MNKIGKSITILILIFVLLSLHCCVRINYTSLEQSKRNFQTYKTQLDEIATGYGYKLEATNDNKHLSIIIDDCKEIRIYLEYTGNESSSGIERFTITYSLSNSETTSDFNIGLFVDLVNCISGKTITSDFCEEFLSAPENKYSAGKYGLEKQGRELVEKMHALNFMEDWMITYGLNNDKTQDLSFWGLTKKAVE